MVLVQDQNLINQAKRLLIIREKITESQAHRLIQKRSMNLRISKIECATQIIEKYNQPLGQVQKGRKRSKTLVVGDNPPSKSVFFNTEKNTEAEE